MIWHVPFHVWLYETFKRQNRADYVRIALQRAKQDQVHAEVPMDGDKLNKLTRNQQRIPILNLFFK